MSAAAARTHECTKVPSEIAHLYTVHVMCVTPLTFLCVMLHWHCVCDAGNGVAVSVNDIIIKLVATTPKFVLYIGYSYSM